MESEKEISLLMSVDRCSDENKEQDGFMVLSSPPSSDEVHFPDSLDLLNNLHLSLASASPDLSYEEIQDKLKELLKENLELKELLQQNNINMKVQFQTLITWQEQINQVHKSHRIKFEESRLLVQKLRDENHSLSDRVAQLEKTLADQEKIKNNFQREVKELTRKVQMAEEDKEEALAELERQQVICRHLEERVQEISMDNETLLKTGQVEKCGHAGRTEDMQARLIKNGCKQGEDSSLYPVSVEDFGYTVVNQSGSTDDEVNQIRNNEEKDEFLPNMAAQTCGQKLASNSLHTKNSEKSQFLMVCGQQMDMASSVLQKSGDRCADLDNLLLESQHRLQCLDLCNTADVEQLKCEITNLQQKLQEEETCRKEERKQVLEVQQQFTQLFADYQDLLLSVESYELEQKDLGTQGEAWIQLEKRKHQEELDAVTAQLVYTQELLARYKEESVKLNIDLSQLKLQMERLPVLEGQVELYRQECNQEKEAHKSTQEELKQLKEEYQRLLNHNQELMDEINVYAHSQLVQLQKELSPPENWDVHHSQPLTTDPDKIKEEHTLANLETELEISNNTDVRDPVDPTDTDFRYHMELPELMVYCCPRCDMGFTNFQALQNHVDSCLEKNDPFLL